MLRHQDLVEGRSRARWRASWGSAATRSGSTNRDRIENFLVDALADRLTRLSVRQSNMKPRPGLTPQLVPFLSPDDTCEPGHVGTRGGPAVYESSENTLPMTLRGST